jgi:hypothetical protein
MANTKKRPAKKSKKTNRATTSKAVALIKKESPQSSVPSTLSLANPHDVMEFGKVLKKYIVSNNLSVPIEGKDYAKVDAWKFAGLNFGLTAIPRTPESRHILGQYITVLFINKEYTPKNKDKYTKEVPVFVGYQQHQEVIQQVRDSNKGKISREVVKPYFAYACGCDIVKLADGSKVSYGEGFCSNLESAKSGNDEYAINSQAQTRSIGKAYRNLIGFVMNAAGYETTPAEEMDSVDMDNRDRTTKAKPSKKKTLPDDRFNNLLSLVIAGDIALVKRSKETFDLTDKQIEALDIAEKNVKDTSVGAESVEAEVVN